MLGGIKDDIPNKALLSLSGMSSGRKTTTPVSGGWGECGRGSAGSQWKRLVSSQGASPECS